MYESPESPWRSRLGIYDWLVFAGLSSILLVLGGTTEPPIPGLALILAVYLAKFRITFAGYRNRHGPVLSFAAVLALAVAYGYVFLAEWNDPFAKPWADLASVPIALLFVPLASFYVDMVRGPGNLQKSKLRHYWIRTAIEVVVISPLWWIVWAVVEYMLGWRWFVI